MSEATSNQGRFIWREIMSRDAAKSKTFYQELFGWTYDEMPMDSGGIYTIIKQDNRGIGGIMQLTPEQPPFPTHWESYVCVKDVDESIAAAQKNGGKVTWGPMEIPGTGRMAGVAGFDGAALSVMRPTPADQPRPMPPPIGTFCWETLTTSDVDRASKFWPAVTGWKTSTGAGMPTFAVGDGMENQVADIHKVQGRAPASWTTFVVASKLETSLEKAAKLGGQVVAPITAIPTIGRLAVIIDDQHAAIGLFEPAR